MPIPGATPIHARWPEQSRTTAAWTEAWLLDQAGQDVTVETYDGQGAYGEIYGPPRTVRCLVDDRRRLVRTAQGDEVVSETTIVCDLGEDIPPESRITVGGRATTVIATTRMDGGTLPTPRYLELALA